MTIPAIGRIERVSLREVWPHEAFDFSVWLETNIDVLNDYLAIPIEPDSVSREVAAGAFSIDLVAEDAQGESVIIENQLERSNHDHLGKLITYAAARSARTAIWIVADPRDEHVRAVSWLNDAGLAEFWLFKIEAIRIGDSLPAPSLTKIVGPAEEREILRPSASPQRDERNNQRRSFFAELLEYARNHTTLHANSNPVGSPWLGRRVARGISWVYGVRTNGTRVMLYIDRGAGHIDENDAIYQSLLEHKNEIELAVGGTLDWEAKESNRSRTVSLDLEKGGWADRSTWSSAIEATVATMIKLEGSVRPFLNEAIAAADEMAELPTGDVDVFDEPAAVEGLS